jgi:hypothetical protein
LPTITWEILSTMRLHKVKSIMSRLPDQSRLNYQEGK